MNSWIKASAGAALALSAAWAGAADVLQIRGMASACASCHGTNGIAEPGMASLAGQPKEELLKKMLDYKTGKKPATLMHQISKGYTDEQLEQLSGYFAALKK